MMEENSIYPDQIQDLMVKKPKIKDLKEDPFFLQNIKAIKSVKLREKIG